MLTALTDFFKISLSKGRDIITVEEEVKHIKSYLSIQHRGDDNLLSDEEKTDLEYRKAQLKRLQEEVVDIEDMSTGISIMDLGLNEFRMDLLEYIKNHPRCKNT